MDDVLHITAEPKELQIMLNITENLAGRYHIEFGEPKSKAMKIGGGKNKPEFNLGAMKLEYCAAYKYLGLLQNEKNNMKDHIQALKGKVEAAYQTIIAITGNRTISGIEMKAMWELLECTIIPIITYGCEVWNLNKSETKSINNLLDNIIRRVLMTPQTTPREALYIETGLLDPETISHKQKVMMDFRLKNNKNHRLQKLANPDEHNLWKTISDLAKGKLEITAEETQGKKPRVKTNIKNKTARYFKKILETSGKDKSKIKYLLDGRPDWKPLEKQKYLTELSRINASTIFLARTRMIDVKNNFRNKYPDNTCRACGSETETQEHVLETCQTIHENPDSKVSKNDLFNEDPTALQETSKRIRNTLEELTRPIVQLAYGSSTSATRGST